MKFNRIRCKALDLGNKLNRHSIGRWLSSLLIIFVKDPEILNAYKLSIVKKDKLNIRLNKKNTLSKSQKIIVPLYFALVIPWNRFRE